MRFRVDHVTAYHYSAPVRLGAHRLRLRPRCGGGQVLVDYRLEIAPEPILSTEYSDLEGNTVMQVWFTGETDSLSIRAWLEVETLRTNPFDYLVEMGAMAVPLTYPTGVREHLIPYCTPRHPGREVQGFALSLGDEAQAQTLVFLNLLNHRLFAGLERIIRHHGEPQPPEVTLATRRGACRDVTLLFMEVCRNMGLAARFVSGYQRGDLHRDRRYLHAWPEVYIPGGGWRGYDPAHGLAVGDAHVAVAAAADPRQASPVEGTFAASGVSSRLETALSIHVV